MKLSESVKPISYLKANAAGIIREFSSGGGHTLIITQNGEAKAVLMDIKTYDEYQESMAMLKILAQSKSSLQSGKVKPAKQAIEDIKKRIDRSR
jgi:prevent-host-death family protein